MIDVRDGDCNLVGRLRVTINSWDEVFPIGSQFAQDVMASLPADDKYDEVYWTYKEV